MTEKPRRPPPLSAIERIILITLIITFTFGIVALSGCSTTNAPYRGVFIGPYDITLTSHQEALGIRP